MINKPDNLPVFFNDLSLALSLVIPILSKVGYSIEVVIKAFPMFLVLLPLPIIDEVFSNQLPFAIKLIIPELSLIVRQSVQKVNPLTLFFAINKISSIENFVIFIVNSGSVVFSPLKISLVNKLVVF